ncbi:hypothetical protein BGZ94_005030 [Podila epigama]|nr:hypothetical protein BGZ94_005030 [Podila epigama]
MSFLPEEIATLVFEALTPADLVNCATVSRLWHRLVNDQMLWQQLFIKFGFIYPRGLTITGRRDPSEIEGTISRKRKWTDTRTTATGQRHRRYLPQTIRSKDQWLYQMTYRNQCWKALYRLNYNWTMGQAQVTQLSLDPIGHYDHQVPGSNNTISSRNGSCLLNSSSTPPSLPETAPPPGLKGIAPYPLVRFKDRVILVATSQGLVHLWRLLNGGNSGRTDGAESVPSSLPHGLCPQPVYWQTFTCPTSPEDKSPPQITALCLDTSTRGRNKDITQESDWQRVMVGYASGHFSIFEYYRGPFDSPPNNNEINSSVTKDSSRLIGSTTQLGSWSKVGAVQSACFQFPMLTTFSQEDGAISVYRIHTTGDADGSHVSPREQHGQHWCRLLHRLYGASSQSPVEMELSLISFANSLNAASMPVKMEEEGENIIGRRAKDGTQYKRGIWRIRIAFGLQLLDGSWTVRLQEIEFDERTILWSKETGVENGPGVAEDPLSDMSEHGFESTCPASTTTGATLTVSSSVSNSIGVISSIKISWPYVVTTHSDNTLNVFQMSRVSENSTSTVGTTTTSTTAEESSKTTRIRRQRTWFRHVSTLYGHCGAVSSVAIEPGSGRLVSASMDRSIKIWTLSPMPQQKKRWVVPNVPLSIAQPFRFEKVGYESSASWQQKPSSSLIPMRSRQQEQIQREKRLRQHECSVSMSNINQSWTTSGQVTKEEGMGLIWVDADEEKIVSMSCDGTIKVWQFS